MKNTIVFIIMATALLGCYNVGSYSQYVSNETNLNVYPVYATGSTGCAPYVRLTSKPLPELPFEEIKQAKLKSTGEAEAIMVKHIRELREYVVGRNKEEDAHYATYLSKCTTALK